MFSQCCGNYLPSGECCAALEEMAQAGVVDPFDARDRAALARIGYTDSGLDPERLARAMDAYGYNAGLRDGQGVAAEYARLTSSPTAEES